LLAAQLRPAGQRFLLSMYGPGDITSLIRLLTDAPFHFGFHAREPSTVVHIPCDAMTAVLDAHPILWKDLCLLMLALSEVASNTALAATALSAWPTS